MTNRTVSNKALPLPSQPVGALNPKRAVFYAERYEAWEDEQSPPCHYSTHYSTATSALSWLVRIVSAFPRGCGVGRLPSNRVHLLVPKTGGQQSGRFQALAALNPFFFL